MSGGVGPTYGDISLPKEQPQVEHEQPLQASLKSTQPQHKKTSFLSFPQLNALAVIIVLSASGMVSLEDFGFVVFSFIYIYFMSKIAFPAPTPQKDSRIFDPKNKILRSYVLFAGIIGLLLPIAYIFHGVLEGDKEGTKAAAPHLFLLASQVFMEGVTFSVGFSAPIRMFVPIMYNSKRIFTLEDWLKREFFKVEEGYGSVSSKRLYVGRLLAVANMAIWCFNLFGFLLPVALPRAMKKYYTGNNKVN